MADWEWISPDNILHHWFVSGNYEGKKQRRWNKTFHLVWFSVWEVWGIVDQVGRNKFSLLFS